MALDLPAIVRRLQEVEARHPDVADELDPVIRALTGEEAAMIGIEQARELLGAASADEVGALLTLGILPGYAGGPDWAVDHSPFVVLLMKWQRRDLLHARQGDALALFYGERMIGRLQLNQWA